MFATNLLAARLAAGWIPPLALTFWRWLFTVLLGAAVRITARSSDAALLREWRSSLGLGAIGMAMCGTYLAVQSTTTLNIGLIYASSPVVMALLSAASLDERLGRWQFAGILLCLGGSVVIVSRGNPGQFAAL